MLVYGLTGKSGCGKSTAAAILAKKGYFVIDGDKLARQVTEKGSPVLALLCERFGRDILTKDGSLNRGELAACAFKDEPGVQALNSITHPAIDEAIREKLAQAQSAGFERCLIDAAALLESPSRRLCDRIIVITAPPQIRLERILKRDDITREQALKRMNAQKNDEYYLNAADIIIRNYPPYVLEEELLKLE